MNGKNGAIGSEILNLTIGEYWKKWQAECRGQVSDGWKLTQDQMARDFVLPYLERHQLNEVRPQDVGLLLEKARSVGLAPQTVKHVYSLLHKVFEDAVEHYGILSRNPVLGRYRPKVYRGARGLSSHLSSPGSSWSIVASTT